MNTTQSRNYKIVNLTQPLDTTHMNSRQIAVYENGSYEWVPGWDATCSPEVQSNLSQFCQHLAEDHPSYHPRADADMATKEGCGNLVDRLKFSYEVNHGIKSIRVKVVLLAANQMNPTQSRNLKKRAKAHAKRVARREELLTAEPVIKTVLHLLEDPNADIFSIKRVIDKVSFHSLYEDLSHLDHSDEMKILQQTFSKEWNKAEYRILNVLLPLACVIAAEIREDE